MPPTLIVDDRARLVKAFVTSIEDAAAGAMAARGRFALAVTGGRDLVALLPELVGARVPWRHADIFWGDERAVAATDPDSNYAAVKAPWLDRLDIPTAQVHRMPGEAADLDAGARAYEAELIDVLGPSPELDVCVLGMGPDGHVCSLFPGHPLLSERTRMVAAIADSPKPPPRRLTLTLPVLQRSRLVIVTALSPDKRAALDVAVSDPSSPLPVAQVIHAAARAVVLRGQSL